MNKKGFTLIELIAVITLFSIISLLVFGALTGSIKSASVKEMEVYRDNVSRAAQVYVETNLENYTLDSPGKYMVLKGAKIIEAGYLDKSIKNPSSCPIEEVNIRIYMESDYTLSYAVYCDGEEPPLSDGSEPVVPETPATPEQPVTPSQTLYVFEYTGSVQEVTLPAGKWKLEVWGAQGGDSFSSRNSGGNGGYSTGEINLSSSTNLYIYVGGMGENGYGVTYSQQILSGGFNGGGAGGYSGSQLAGGGGGTTDIRIGTDSLYARVIVAGGGGSSSSGSSRYGGGVGGGLLGANGSNFKNPGESGSGGGGGTQIGGGIMNSTYVGNVPATKGEFGLGGNGNLNGGAATGGGGGAGWYGGAGGDFDGGAGGGSGWVYTADNFSTWQTGNPTDAANWLLNSSYYLTNSETLDGATPFFDPNGAEVTGHSGNGYAKITWVNN